MLALLHAVTLFVLGIACANVANLLLARITDGATEMAVRLSLGASPGRVTRLLLFEVIVLGLLGSAGALLVGRVTLNGVRTLLPPEDAPMMEFAIDGTVLVFTLAIGLGTTSPVRSLSDPSRCAGGGGQRPARPLTPCVRLASGKPVPHLDGDDAGRAGDSAAGRRRPLPRKSRQRLAHRAWHSAGRPRHVPALAVSEWLHARAFASVVRPGSRTNCAALPGVTSVTATTVPILTGGGSTNKLTVEGFSAGPEADMNASYWTDEHRLLPHARCSTPRRPRVHRRRQHRDAAGRDRERGLRPKVQPRLADHRHTLRARRSRPPRHRDRRPRPLTRSTAASGIPRRRSSSCRTVRRTSAA